VPPADPGAQARVVELPEPAGQNDDGQSEPDLTQYSSPNAGGNSGYDSEEDGVDDEEWQDWCPEGGGSIYCSIDHVYRTAHFDYRRSNLGGLVVIGAIENGCRGATKGKTGPLFEWLKNLYRRVRSEGEGGPEEAIEDESTAITNQRFKRIFNDFGDQYEIAEEFAPLLCRSYAPTGGDVELERLNFYFNRALQTPEPFEGKQLFRNYQKMVDRSLDHVYRNCPIRNDNMYFYKSSRYMGWGIKKAIWHKLYTKLDASKDPGCPLSNAGFPTNGSIPESLLKQLVVDRLNAILFCEEIPSTYQGCVDAQLCDPWKVHVKNELTKDSKIARLIFGGSVVDRLLWQLLFNDVLIDTIDDWCNPNSVSSIGIDFDKASDFYKCVHTQLDQQKKLLSPVEVKLKSFDIQGYEYKMGQPMLQAFFGPILFRYQKSQRFRLQHKLLRVMSTIFSTRPAVLSLSNGRLVQAKKVIMLSGFLLTHFINTITRASIAQMTCYENMAVDLPPQVFQKANGDDGLGGHTEFSKRNYERLGFVITEEEVDEQSDAFSFCSQFFHKTFSYPETVFKSFANFTFHSDDVSRELQLKAHVMTHPKRDLLLRFATVLACHGKSTEEANRIWKINEICLFQPLVDNPLFNGVRMDLGV